MKRVSKIPFLLMILLTAILGRVQAENLAEKPPWSYNSKDYEYSGELNAVLIKDGEELKSGYLGAFVGDECRGYVAAKMFKPTRRMIFTLPIGSNVSSGETISFRYYDDLEERQYFVEETLPFVSKMKVGSTWIPVEYHVSENSAPEVVNPLPDLDLNEYFGSVNIDLEDVFRDEEGDNLTFSVSSSNTSVVTVSLSGTRLTIHEAGQGVSNITVTARDDGKPSLSTNETFRVTVNNVNDPPEVVKPAPDLLLLEGFGTENIAVSGIFMDQDGDVLQYTVSVDDPSVVTVSLSGSSLVISESGTGKAVVMVCASDGEFKVCDSFSVTVEALNNSPVANCSNFSDTVGFYGSGVFTVESICNLFSDPDGDELTYSVTSSDHAIATAELDGCSMDVTVLGVGIATFTICASDGEDEVCCAFDLIVDEENMMELFVMDKQLFEGDTIGHSSNPDTVVLIVYSMVPWEVESEDDWIAVTKANIYNAEIAFSENKTGAARRGNIVVRDLQEHVVNLVVYQSADRGVTSVEGVSGGFGVRCYPNPVSGLLTIELEGELFDGEVTLVLFDGVGRRLQEVRTGVEPVDRGVLFLEMDQYPPGTYFLRVADLRGARVLVPVLKE